jgi:hypothetical protein
VPWVDSDSASTKAVRLWEALMSNLAVQEILDKIEHLSEEDRLCVAKRLAETSEAQWSREAEDARRIAREKGIDQRAIDRAVDEVRHPA